MQLRPLHDWAVIRQLDTDEMTAGGIYIPDSAREKPHEGVVVSIGPGALEEEKLPKKKEENKERRFIPTTLKPGDMVLYEKYAGQTYTIGQEDLVLVRERDILGTISGRQPRVVAPAKPLLLPGSTPIASSSALVVKKTAAMLPVVQKKKTAATTGARKKTAAKAEVKRGAKAKKPVVKKAAKKTPAKAAKKKTTKKAGKKAKKK